MKIRYFLIKDVSKNDINKKIKFPKRITPLLSEMCGIHIGDGYLGHRKNKSEYVVQWVGHQKDDRDHYNNYISKSWKSLFNIDVNLQKFPSNTYGFRIYSKGIAWFFHRYLEMPFGKKSRIIRIPNIIKNTCKNKVSDEMVSCIRGIMDTDFYLVSDRGYPELGAWFASRNLVIDLSKYLNKLGITNKVKLDVRYYNTSSKKYLIRHQIRIRKKKDIIKWMSVIGTNNQKIYKRYKRIVNVPCWLHNAPKLF